MGTNPVQPGKGKVGGVDTVEYGPPSDPSLNCEEYFQLSRERDPRDYAADFRRFAERKISPPLRYFAPVPEDINWRSMPFCSEEMRQQNANLCALLKHDRECERRVQNYSLASFVREFSPWLAEEDKRFRENKQRGFVYPLLVSINEGPGGKEALAYKTGLCLSSQVYRQADAEAFPDIGAFCDALTNAALNTVAAIPPPLTSLQAEQK